MASPIVTNAGADLNGKTLLLAETSASVSGGLIPSGDGVQVGWVLRKSLTLTNAQIKLLPTTPVTFLAAPGAGKTLIPVAMVVVARTVAGYTNIDAAAVMQITYPINNHAAFNYIANDAAITNAYVGATQLTNLIGGIAIEIQRLTPFASTEGVDALGPVATSELLSDMENQPWVISIDNASAGALTGGNVANTLTFIGYYIVIQTT